MRIKTKLAVALLLLRHELCRIDGCPKKAADGGAGSGNHGHKGLPGQVGDSAPKGSGGGLTNASKSGKIEGKKGLVNRKTGQPVKSKFEPMKPKRGELKGFEFNWDEEPRKGNEVHALKTEDGEIQGMVAFRHERGYTYLALVESAPHNSPTNKNFKGEKKFDNVGGKLFAFAAKKSIEAGNDGFIALDAKTKLIPYYEKAFGAIRRGRTLMEINEVAARELIKKYDDED